MFGSKCFPYIWNTKNHKFDPKIVLCVFVGYSDKHKGYKCFHPPSRNFFLSRHVVFDETMFPLKSASTSSSVLHVQTIFDSWLPATTTPLEQDISSHEPNCIPLPAVTNNYMESAQPPSEMLKLVSMLHLQNLP